MTIQPYVMAMCQPQTQVAFGADRTLQPDILAANLDHYCALIAKAARDHDAKLIAFPQFGITGYAMGLSIDDWVAASFTFPGPELDRIGQAAKAAGAYVVVQAAEKHPAFPGRYFLSAALINPAGEVELVYRKHYTLSLRTSPIDVHDDFVAAFGPDAFYPVADTPLGAIGLVIGAEAHWPEAFRSLALKGAEVIINPIAAVPLLDYLKRAAAPLVRPVRAFENMVYLGVANMGGHGPAPLSEIYDYEGGLIAQAPAGADVFALATIDIEALRTARGKPAGNFLAQLQPSIHEDIHGLPLWPDNAFAQRAETYDELVGMEAKVWAGLQAAKRGKGPQTP